MPSEVFGVVDPRYHRLRGHTWPEVFQRLRPMKSVSAAVLGSMLSASPTLRIPLLYIAVAVVHELDPFNKTTADKKAALASALVIFNKVTTTWQSITGAADGKLDNIYKVKLNSEAQLLKLATRGTIDANGLDAYSLSGEGGDESLDYGASEMAHVRRTKDLASWMENSSMLAATSLSACRDMPGANRPLSPWVSSSQVCVPAIAPWCGDSCSSTGTRDASLAQPASTLSPCAVTVAVTVAVCNRGGATNNGYCLEIPSTLSRI